MKKCEMNFPSVLHGTVADARCARCCININSNAIFEISDITTKTLYRIKIKKHARVIEAEIILKVGTISLDQIIVSHCRK